MSSRIEAVMEHLTYTKGVVGVVLCTVDGVPIRDSFQQLDRSIALMYTEMASAIARQASLLYLPMFEPEEKGSGKDKKKEESAETKKSGKNRNMIVDDTLEMIRVRTKMNEIIVKRNDEFLLVVVQEPGE